MKKMIFAALLAACIGCSNQEDVVMETGNKVSLSVKLNFSDFQTKSGDTAIDDLPEWSQLLLIAYNSDNEIKGEVSLSKKEFKKLIPARTIQILEKSNDPKLVGGKVLAYVVATGNEWGTITTDYESQTRQPNLPVLTNEQKDINNWQPGGFIKAEIAGKFVNVPYYGVSSAIIDNGPSGDGHHQLTATVDVIPELSRIQVLNTPKEGGTKDVNGNTITVTSLTVENIYVNRVTTNGKIEDIRTNVDQVESDWFDEFYAESKSLVGLTDIGTDKGYQIFDQDRPQVIVKVTYQLNGEAKDYTGYLTIEKYNYGTVVSDDLLVSKGKVYDIDLSKLQPTYDQIGDEPYDKTVYYDLSVDVTVHDWVKVPVDPEL